jgi:hypothetical protein
VPSIITAEETEQNHESLTPDSETVTGTTVANSKITMIKRVTSIQKAVAQTPCGVS